MSLLSLSSKGESQFPAIWSEEGKYLASVLGDALVKGLTQVSQERPEDPVEYLANFLRKYGKDDNRPGSPAFEEDEIAQAAAAATVTTMALHHGIPPSEALPGVEEQTEDATSEDPVETSDEPTEEQTSEDQPPEEQISEDPGDTTAQEETLAEDEPTQTQEEETGAETETQGEVEQVDEDQNNDLAQEDADMDEPGINEEEPMEQDVEEEEGGAAEEPKEEEEEKPEEGGGGGGEGEAKEGEEQEARMDGENEAEPPEKEKEAGGEGEVEQVTDNAKEAQDDDEMLKRLEAEVEEQNAEEREDEDAIHIQEEMINGDDEIEGAGQRDERGQSVLHFAAARPGGAQTLLAFLQNPTVNLAWRDERMKTARDVASSLNRSENLQTIDSYVVSKAVAGDLETLQKLLLDGYDHLAGVEDTYRNTIIDLTEKAGQENVVDFLKSVPQFQGKLDKLMDSIRLGDLERVKESLQDEPKLAITMGKHGRTPLHVAVLCEEYSIVQHIAQTYPQALRRGDNMERTALHYAMGIEKVEKMTRILVRMGAKRVLKDIKGRQPSYYFINREEIAILQEQEKST